ncbi:MAG TPA: protein kinase, partial [Kofleriaceae bacterium]|nr:protein kinase [Kofleriaceae bacterium]
DNRAVDVAKVLDFGISKIRGSQTVKTQEAALLGTPQYMAPEQATGQHANVDERTDVFALGAIVYEMFTGRPAFSGASIPEVVFKVVYEQPASLAQQVPTLPPAITSAVAQAMAKPSDERFPTVAGFVEAVTGQPLTLNRSAAGPGVAPAADAPSTGRRVPSGDAFAQTMGSGDHGESPVNPLLATAAPGAAIPGASPLSAGSLASGTAGARAGTAAALASGTAHGPRAPGVGSASTPPIIAAAPTVDIPSLRGEPPARRRTGLIAAIAFVAAAAIGGGIYAVTRSSGPPGNPTASADDRHGNPPGPRANAGLPGDRTTADSKGIPPNPTGDTKSGDAKTGDSTAGDTKLGDGKVGDSTTHDTKAGDAKAGDTKVGDAKAGDAKAGDAKTGKPGAKPDPRLKPKNPGAGARQPDDNVEGDEDARQKLAQAMAAVDGHNYDQAERLANAVINAPGSPRQHATARMIHGIVQCAARNDQEAANIDLRSLENFRNLRGRLLNVCRSHGVFTTR